MDIQGNVPGFSSYLSRFTDKSELLCVTLCANKEGVDLSGLARRIAGAFDRKLGPPSGAPTMRMRESCHPVSNTFDRLQNILKSRGIEISARIDHAQAAAKKGLELRPSEVLIFGNPAIGTKLMQSRSSIALDLPLRVVVWQETDGTVWLGWHEPREVGLEHSIQGRGETIEAIRTGLESAIDQAANPY